MPLDIVPPEARPLVTTPVRTSASQLFAVADSLDRAMYRATAKIGERGRVGFLAGELPKAALLLTGVVGTVVSILALPIGMDAGWGVAAKIWLGAALAIGTPSAMIAAGERAKHRVLDPEFIEPFAKARAGDSDDIRALVAALAGRWRETLRSRGVAGEASRRKLAELATAPQLPYDRAKTIDAIAQILTLVRDENGRPLTELTKARCAELTAQLQRLDGQDFRDAADFVRKRLFKNERPRVAVESQVNSQELYSLLASDLPPSAPTSPGR